MVPYKNLNGNSGALRYKYGDDYITIMFRDGSVYNYTYASTGKMNVEQMKKLAQKGKGLTTFINKYVKGKFEK